ncbi:protein HESO1-like [Lolium rigidum]|uniref:protein HESO1-like n=1 Tax=Lolium rigidum TaxID=89674 RepID=UPI001F5C28F1|nr:protein HESO1-like [Lolium rigidum]
MRFTALGFLKAILLNREYQGLSMIFVVKNYRLLEECAKDILSVIKPTEEDQNKRLGAVKEIVNLVGSLRGVDAAVTVKPFGSFVSKLYAKSGDLDVSVELANYSGFPTGKKRKKNALRELGAALRTKGVARDVKYILSARVPVIKYVSNYYGLPCDISIDNYSGRIKSKLLYWINTIDERFGDMVLLVKEWAKAQNINDPKNGTLSSYALCLLVISHFQHYEPAILPPMREIFIASIAEGSGGFNEKHFDQIWEENIAKFRCREIGQRNPISLSRILANFFGRNSLNFLTYYAGRTPLMTKSSCEIVNDPFDRDGAMIKVDVPGFQRIASAFKRATDIIDSYEDTPGRNELVSLLCTPEVCSKLGGTATADRYTGSTGGGPISRPQRYNSGRQGAAPY